MSKTTWIFLLSGFCLGGAISAQAATVAAWTFEEGAPSAVPTEWTSSSPAASTGNSPAAAPFASDVSLYGSGSATAYHASSASGWYRVSGNGSARAFNSDRWGIGDYYQFSFAPVAGSLWSGLSLEWDQTRSSSGPGTFYLAYSTDGTAFTRVDASDYTITSTSWSASTFNSANHQVRDLSGLADLNTALNGGNTVYFRVINNVAPTSTGGTARIDNFMIMAPVPEPATGALAGLGLILACTRSRWLRKI